MSHSLWLALAAFISSLCLLSDAAHALTPEEVLRLKAAGVSEDTIQLLLRNERESRLSSEKLEQGYATDHMGTWKLRDGRTISSTGKRQLPLHYPTEYPPASEYAPHIYPDIDVPSRRIWRRSSPALGESEAFDQNTLDSRLHPEPVFPR